MTYFSSVTSKGTITVPAKVRKQLGIKPGMMVTIEVNKKGNAEIMRPVDIEDLRKRTAEHLRKMGFTPKKLREMAENYQNGDGITAHVLEKYGRPS